MPTTYHKHVVTIGIEGLSNYCLRCLCGYRENIASLSDVFAAKQALRHVIDANTPKPDPDGDPDGEFERTDERLP